jgi:hypothetical protein
MKQQFLYESCSPKPHQSSFIKHDQISHHSFFKRYTYLLALIFKQGVREGKELFIINLQYSKGSFVNNGRGCVPRLNLLSENKLNFLGILLFNKRPNLLLYILVFASLSICNSKNNSPHGSSCRSLQRMDTISKKSICWFKTRSILVCIFPHIQHSLNRLQECEVPRQSLNGVQQIVVLKPYLNKCIQI